MTKVGLLTISHDVEIVVQDPRYEVYTTPDLVHFSVPSSKDTFLRVTDDNLLVHTIAGRTSLHGTAIPDPERSLMLFSMLNTSNADGCMCPALRPLSGDQTFEDVAIAVFRGGCSFYEKSMNAFGAARVVIVVDAERTSETAGGGGGPIRPMLVDDSGRPMASDEAYPSVVSVQGSLSAATLQEGRTVSLLRPSESLDERVQMFVRGQVVANMGVVVQRGM